MGMPWYKVWENFWVNPKIQYIESKSCGDTTICIFHKLLTHLTKHESIDGVLMLGKRPLMIDELHCIINRSVSQIQEAVPYCYMLLDIIVQKYINYM